MKRLLYLCFVAIICICMIGCTNDKAFKIGDSEYSKEEVEKVKTILIETSNYIDENSLKELKDSEGDKYEKKLNDIIISYMIDREVVYDKAKSDYKVTDDEVNNKYNQIKELLDLNKDYKKHLEKAGVDEEYLKETIKKDLVVSKYRENFEKDIIIKDSEIEKYYNEHKDDFKEESVKASHILFTTVDDNNKSLSESEINEKKSKAEEVLSKIKSGESFEDLAKENSDDKNSGKRGGDLGYFNKTDKNAQFTKVVFGLKKNQVSEVFETPYGYEIVKVTDKKNVQKTLDESKDKIKNILLTEKYLDNVKTLRDKTEITRYE